MRPRKRYLTRYIWREKGRQREREREAKCCDHLRCFPCSFSIGATDRSSMTSGLQWRISRGHRKGKKQSKQILMIDQISPSVYGGKLLLDPQSIWFGVWIYKQYWWLNNLAKQLTRAWCNELTRLHLWRKLTESRATIFPSSTHPRMNYGFCYHRKPVKYWRISHISGAIIRASCELKALEDEF